MLTLIGVRHVRSLPIRCNFICKVFFHVPRFMKNWDKTIFKRIPSDLFDDPIWNNGQFTKKEAFLDLFYLAHDSPKNISAILEINEVTVKINPGDVIRGYRSLGERWGWSTKKVGKFLKDYTNLGYLKIIRKHPCTVIRLLCWIPRRKNGGNSEETKGRQLNSNYNKKIKREDPLLSLDYYQKLYPEKDIKTSMSRFLAYNKKQTHHRAIKWFDDEQKTKPMIFSTTPTGSFKAWCPKCKTEQFPPNEYVLKQGCQKCHVSFATKE